MMTSRNWHRLHDQVLFGELGAHHNGEACIAGSLEPNVEAQILINHRIGSHACRPPIQIRMIS